MADILSPGVFVEEVPTAAQIIPGVTTSNLGTVGYAERGPANEAVLVQSFEQYSRIFGGLVTQSLMPLSLAAFFANGGRRAFIVRVPPANAVAANAKIQSDITDDSIGTGDGVTTAFTGSFPTAAGASPLVPGSINVNWRSAGAPVVAQNARNRDSTANLSLVTAQASYDGRINPAGLPTLVNNLDAVVRGTVTINFTLTGPGAQAILIPAGTGSIVQASVGDGTDGAIVILDSRSGRFSLRTFGTFVPVLADNGALVTVDFTPTTATRTAVDGFGAITIVAGASLVDTDAFIIDDGVNPPVTFEYDSNGASTGLPIPFTLADSVATVQAATIAAINNAPLLLLKAEAVAGSSTQIKLVPNSSVAPTPVLSESVAAAGFSVAPIVASAAGLWLGDVATPGSVDYSSGAFALDLTGFIPCNKSPLLSDYTLNAWSVDPISVGAWGNNLQVQIAGSPNFFDASTGVYTRFDMLVLLRNTPTSTFNVVEQYEEMVFDDSSSPVYFADVVNELSDLIRVNEPAGDIPPYQLNAVPHTLALGGGNALAPNRVFSTSLGGPIAPRTVSIAYTDTTGTARVITDDGDGNLVGSVLTSVDNTIDYETGAVEFTTLLNIKGATLVVATFADKVAETVHSEILGDTSKNYLPGEEGTFDSTNWGRSQFTDATALAATYKGMYAFNKVEELLQITIVDFAGNVIISQDQLDYAAGRALMPQGGDRFIILATPAGLTAQKAVDWFRFSLVRSSDYAALYWPWVRVSNPLMNNRPTLMPPLGHVAGVYARTDNNRNVGKSPGGTVDGALTYLVGLETAPTQEDRDLVYPNKINSLISSTQTGLAVWGVRTISQVPDWRYINARRLFMFLEKSIFNATWWIVFENNGPGLWSRITAQLDSYMGNLFSQGFFAGVNPQQAYFVVCDSSNNTPATIEAGQVIIDIGAAPNKPAEFVRMRFQQKSLNS